MFEQLLSRYAADLDSAMRRVVDQISPEVSKLATMARYPLGWEDEAGRPYAGQVGKRIRPLFLLLCTEAAGGDWKRALPAAAAVELLHNFSLIHDDIQDQSPVRHNRPTVWQVWGIAHAINAGDLLFSLSFCALEDLSQQEIAPETVLRIWEVFNNTNLELTRGQYLDMSFEARSQVTIDEYLSMIRGKSAALLAACAQIGALIATGNHALAETYGEFALNLGIAFQIRDDILGIWGDPTITGKSAATDIISRKKSLPALYGLSRSAAFADLYQREDFSAQNVLTAVNLLDEINAREYALEIEAQYFARAHDALERAAPQGESASWLNAFVEALFRRTY